MISSFGKRKFQLWEYCVSHGSLLIRSPRNSDFSTNIDIICTGVEYMEVSHYLDKINVVDVSSVELQKFSNILERDVQKSTVHVLASGTKRFAIISASFQIDENEMDIFDSPFAI